MLLMFCNVFSSVFQVVLQVFQKHVSSVSFVFGRMLQMLHLDVSKVDLVLHMGMRMGSGRGHERSSHTVRRCGRRPGGVEDVGKGGHPGGDVLGPLVFIYSATHVVMLTLTLE
jgi:hypothetical protein